ncbi:hypothetical protein [Streptomyces sp. NPDC059928]|uniref:hypothetical protein n=1 Tax=unclassified Streptomyces TaxID=2593676 RepID=UPI0036636488
MQVFVGLGAGDGGGGGAGAVEGAPEDPGPPGAGAPDGPGDAGAADPEGPGPGEAGSKAPAAEPFLRGSAPPTPDPPGLAESPEAEPDAEPEFDSEPRFRPREATGLPDGLTGTAAALPDGSG